MLHSDPLMKNGFRRYQAWLLTIIPIFLWGGAHLIRPHWVEPICAQTPDQCTPDQVSMWERSAIVPHDEHADFLSFLAQYLAGAIVLLVPAAFWITRGAIKNVGKDWLLAFQAVTWNGALMELTRISVQRPRPFVFQDPERLGANIAHYNSFYSGHTSFVATTMVMLILLLIGHRASRGWIAASGAAACLLIPSTGVLRVLAGRHFPMDVIVGAIAGSLIAIVLSRIQRPKTSAGRP